MSLWRSARIDRVKIDFNEAVIVNDNGQNGQGKPRPPHAPSERAHSQAEPSPSRWDRAPDFSEPMTIGCEDGADDVAWRTTPQATAAYITDLLDGLSLLAQRAELTSLAYLLAVAAREARDQSTQRE